MTTDRLDQLRKLHAVDPADADVPYMIALELAKTDTLGDALDWLDKAIAIDPDHHYAYYQKGRLLAADNRTDEARAALRQGLKRAESGGNAKAAGELKELLATVD